MPGKKKARSKSVTHQSSYSKQAAVPYANMYMGKPQIPIGFKGTMKDYIAYLQTQQKTKPK